MCAIGSDGRMRWKTHLGYMMFGSPAVNASGVVLLGVLEEPGGLCAVNGDGTLRWRLEGRFEFTSPAIGADGTIYVVSTNGLLYAIQGTSAIADTPWPMFRHDCRRTGRAGGP